MKKFYVDELVLNKIKNLKHMCSVSSEHLILTNSYLIKVENFNYIKYDFIEKPPTIRNILEHKHLYIDNSYFKKSGDIDQIPYNHKKIEIVKYKYEILPKNKVFFVKEFLDKELIDYYFLSNENIDIVENSIITFLQELN